MSKWWLISDEDIRKIQYELNLIDSCDNADSNSVEKVRHWISSGLHETPFPVVPEDFKDESSTN